MLATRQNSFFLFFFTKLNPNTILFYLQNITL